MKKGMPVLLCGLAAIVATILLYFALLSNVLLEAIHFIALVAIVLSEAVTTGYAYFAKGSPRGVAAAVISVIMVPFSAVLSFIYIVNFPNGYGTYLCWYFAAAIIVNAICMIMLSFDQRKKEEDDGLQAAKQNMLMLRKLVKGILADSAAQPYRARLVALEEELHFSNDCVIAVEDAQIRELLIQLQDMINSGAPGVEEDFTQIEKLVKLRKTTTSRTV